MGYIYLALIQYDKSESAFDRYIEADPYNPNIYDSKGDFYLVTREFKKAYEAYLKVCSMDPPRDHSIPTHYGEVRYKPKSRICVSYICFRMLLKHSIWKPVIYCISDVYVLNGFTFKFAILILIFYCKYNLLYLIPVSYNQCRL